MDVVKLKRKNNVLMTILLLLILIILMALIFGVKVYQKGKVSCNCDANCETDKIISTESLDNYGFVGIYNYEEDISSECSMTTTLILNSDYSAIFYIGDCNYKSYYHGKYRIEEKKINLYSVILNDSTLDEEINVADEEIYFNIVDNDNITSIFGRDKSIKLEKVYNLL